MLVPVEVVTLTPTAPAAPAGVLAVIWVLLRTDTFVALLLPKATCAPEIKFVPVIVTGVPPATGPDVGDTDETVGKPVYVNALASTLLVPAEVVTLTPTAPTTPAGVFAVIWVPLRTDTFVALLLPKATCAPEIKFVPVIVTGVPPATGPVLGDTEETVGGGLPEVCTGFTAMACIIHAPAGLNRSAGGIGAGERRAFIFYDAAIRGGDHARGESAARAGSGGQNIIGSDDDVVAVRVVTVAVVFASVSVPVATASTGLFGSAPAYSIILMSGNGAAG